jgi:hypothetical protein
MFVIYLNHHSFCTKLYPSWVADQQNTCIEGQYQSCPCMFGWWYSWSRRRRRVHGLWPLVDWAEAQGGGFTYFSPRDTSQWWPAQIVLWISFLSAATWHANIPSPLPLSLLCCHSFSFDVRAKANTYHCTNKRLLWSWMEFFSPIQIQTI